MSAAGDRSAAGRRPARRRRCMPEAADNFATLRQAAPLVIERRAVVLRVPPAHGRAHADRRGGVLLGGRVRRRSDPEAREDAARQGRRPHASHAGDRGADRSGVPHLSRRRPRSMRWCSERSIARAAVRLRGAATTSGTSCGTCPPARRRRSSTGSPRFRCSTSPTVTIAPRVRRGRGEALAAEGAGEWDRVLAVAFPDNQMQVLPVQPRGPRPQRAERAEAFLDAVRTRGDAPRGGPASPEASGQVAMRLARRVVHAGDSAAPRRSTSTCSSARCWRRILGITDVRTDTAHRLRRRHPRDGGTRAAGGRRRAAPSPSRCIRSRPAT